MVRFFRVQYIKIVLFLLALILITPFPEFPDLLIADPLFNSVHIIVGMVLYLLCYFYFYEFLSFNLPKQRESSVAVCILLMSIGVAGLIEAIQPFFGRSCSLEDCILSMIGSAFVYLLCTYDGVYRRVWFGIWCFAIFLSSLYPIYNGIRYSRIRNAQFPILAQRGSELSNLIVPMWGAKIYKSDEMPDCAFIVDADPLYSGIEIPLGYQDWSSYDVLELELAKIGDGHSVIGVRIDDKKKHLPYTERYNGKAILDANMEKITFDISQLSKINNFNPLWIKRILIFNNSNNQGLHTCIKRIQLLRSSLDR